MENAERQIGPYRILYLLGKGGMGEVYLAEDARLGRKVALKILPPELTRNEERVRRFQQEARTASALNHPNIITIFDIGEADSAHFIATEFVKGETLRALMSTTRFSVQEVLDVIIQIASALRAAHEVGVVHRDIKPENVMVRPDGIVKVLDFGLAKLSHRLEVGDTSEVGPDPMVKTEPGMLMGTPRYMSPEQVRGLDVDERTDIFSLGVVFYEMVAGKPPFEGTSIGDIIVSLLQQEPASITECTASVPAGLQEIIKRTLCKDRDARYQAIGDFIADLRDQEKTGALDHKLVLPVRSSHAPVIAATTERAMAVPRELVEPRSGEVRKTNLTSSAEPFARGLRRHKLGAAAVLALLILAAAGVTYFSISAPDSPSPINSVAVLPFMNASDDPNMEYLSYGISESLINSLSRLPQLKVITRSSSFKYKAERDDLQEVARALGVRALVIGRVVQFGDQWQVSSELVDTSDKTQMWGEKYSFKVADLLKVQAEISEQIAEKLRLRLTNAEQQQFAKDREFNPQAYERLLQGRFYRNKQSPEELRKAVEYFHEALAIDPNYAPAHAGLAGTYLDLSYSSYVDPKEVLSTAEEAAKTALGLDESLADAHIVLGRIKLINWDWEGAEQEIKRSIELDPNLATAHTWYSLYLSCQGQHDQAIAEARRARELNPRDPKYTANIGSALYFARRYDEAIEQGKRALELDPDLGYTNILLGYMYSAKGLYPEAINEYKKALKLKGDNTGDQCYLGFALAKAGQRRAAEAILKRLQTTRVYVSPFELAVLYSGLGRKEEAFESLNRAYDKRDLQMQYLKVEAHYDSLRSDPRFIDLVRKVGLAP